MPFPLNPFLQSLFGAGPGHDYSRQDVPSDFAASPSPLQQAQPILDTIKKFVWSDPLASARLPQFAAPAPAPVAPPLAAPAPAPVEVSAAAAPVAAPPAAVVPPTLEAVPPKLEAVPPKLEAVPPKLEAVPLKLEAVPPKVGARAAARDPGVSMRESPYTGLATPYMDLPERTPAEQADWQKWWDTKDDTAYSGAGGYHPRPDILELRGNRPHWTSTYGVGVPSNDVLRRYYAGREQVGFQKQEADAKTTAAAAEAAKAKALADELAWKQSPAGQAFAHRNVGIQAGNAALSDQAAQAAAGPGPLAALGPLGLATRPDMLPADVDEFIRQYVAAGGPPIDPGGGLGQELRQKYRAKFDARAQGVPYGLFERFGWGASLPRVFARPGARVLVGPPKPGVPTDQMLRKKFTEEMLGEKQGPAYGTTVQGG